MRREWQALLREAPRGRTSFSLSRSIAGHAKNHRPATDRKFEKCETSPSIFFRGRGQCFLKRWNLREVTTSARGALALDDATEWKHPKRNPLDRHLLRIAVLLGEASHAVHVHHDIEAISESLSADRRRTQP